MRKHKFPISFLRVSWGPQEIGQTRNARQRIERFVYNFFGRWIKKTFPRCDLSSLFKYANESPFFFPSLINQEEINWKELSFLIAMTFAWKTQSTFFFFFLNSFFSAKFAGRYIGRHTQEVKILWPFFIIISDGNFGTHTPKRWRRRICD